MTPFGVSVKMHVTMKKTNLLTFWMLGLLFLMASCNKSNESSLVSAEVPFEDFFDKYFMKNTEKKDLEDLKAVIHPEKGVYFNMKAGVMPVVKLYKNIEEIQKDFPDFKKELSDVKCKRPKNEALPEYDCNDFSKSGCFYQEFANSTVLLEAYKAQTEAVAEEIKDDLAASYIGMDASITHTVIMTKSMLQLYFGKIDGNWFLIYVDLAKFDCGA
jgi:hypothetical protein